MDTKVTLNVRVAIQSTQKAPLDTKRRVVNPKEGKVRAIPVTVCVAGGTPQTLLLPLKIEKNEEGAIAGHYRGTVEFDPKQLVVMDAKTATPQVDLEELLSLD